MKLYDFEKYYIKLVKYKFAVYFLKMWDNKISRYIFLAVYLLVALYITLIIVFYFFIGVNVFLEKVHLEKYRIEELKFKSTEIDLKPYFSK